MNMMSHRLSVYILMLGLLTGCGSQERVKFHEERAILGTFVQIDICAKKMEGAKADRALKDVWARFEDINLRMNAYDPESEVARLHGYKTGENVQVSADLLEVVALSRKVSIETGGLFDITVRPLIDVWNRAGELKKEPAYPEVVSAGLKTGSELIELVDERTMRFLYPGMEIDLGGVAKGYAVDGAARILRAQGFKDFFIDAGGDVYAAGLNLKGERWRIGIQHPRKKDELLDILSISDQAVTTSGDYERFVEIDGKHYSHIINPQTGYPQAGNISATVIAPSAMEADAYSTALMIWDPQAGIACLDELGEGFAALVIAERDDVPRFFSSRNYPAVQSEPRNLSF